MKRTKFSLSNYKLLSCDMGELIPIGLTEVLPGDSIQQSTSALVRVSPLLAPVMHPVHVKIHHWFVPHRLVWDDWENFITGGPDGLNDSIPPYRVSDGTTGVALGSLQDYLGVPPNVPSLEYSELPNRGYQLIWNEWYRDQDLQPAVTISKASGQDTTTWQALQAPAWEKDYFTLARPWTQKGPEVTIPGGITPVTVTGTNPGLMRIASSGGAIGATSLSTNASSQTISTAGSTPLQYNPNGSLVADSDGTLGSINELREAFAIQRYEEARARYGSRYTEYLRYLGIKSSDARLQRPEYLGGGKQTIQFSEVLQTAPGEDDPVGTMRGHGISAMRSNRYRRFFEEHGFVFTLMSVMPKSMYCQGLPRHWNRKTKEDYFQKELQHVGQQAILNKELYATGTEATDNAEFGFGDRYDEYRRQLSSVAGDFRTTLDFWHMARIFGAQPVLNASFIRGSTVTDRVFAVTADNADTLWIMANHSIQARRIVSGNTHSHVF